MQESIYKNIPPDVLRKIEDLERQLEERENELFQAAELGQMVLDENLELQKKIEEMEKKNYHQRQNEDINEAKKSVSSRKSKFDPRGSLGLALQSKNKEDIEIALEEMQITLENMELEKEEEKVKYETQIRQLNLSVQQQQKSLESSEEAVNHFRNALEDSEKKISSLQLNDKLIQEKIMRLNEEYIQVIPTKSDTSGNKYQIDLLCFLDEIKTRLQILTAAEDEITARLNISDTGSKTKIRELNEIIQELNLEVETLSNEKTSLRAQLDGELSHQSLQREEKKKVLARLREYDDDFTITKERQVDCEGCKELYTILSKMKDTHKVFLNAYRYDSLITDDDLEAMNRSTQEIHDSLIALSQMQKDRISHVSLLAASEESELVSKKPVQEEAQQVFSEADSLKGSPRASESRETHGAKEESQSFNGESEERVTIKSIELPQEEECTEEAADEIAPLNSARSLSQEGLHQRTSLAFKSLAAIVGKNRSDTSSISNWNKEEEHDNTGSKNDEYRYKYLLGSEIADCDVKNANRHYNYSFSSKDYTDYRSQFLDLQQGVTKTLQEKIIFKDSEIMRFKRLVQEKNLAIEQLEIHSNALSERLFVLEEKFKGRSDGSFKQVAASFLSSIRKAMVRTANSFDEEGNTVAPSQSRRGNNGVEDSFRFMDESTMGSVRRGTVIPNAPTLPTIKKKLATEAIKEGS